MIWTGPQPTETGYQRLNNPHRNWLPRSAFDLPAEMFGSHSTTPDANLIDIVEEAAMSLGSDAITVVRPIGSLAYARKDGKLSWPLVRDLDIWVYVSAQTLRSMPSPELHAHMQREVHDRLVKRQIYSDLSKRTGYVYLRDDYCYRRLIELKLADLAWLREGLSHTWKRSRKLTWRRHPAFSQRARLEWAAYAAHENHYPSAHAQESFARAIKRIPAYQALQTLEDTYAENLALGMRVLGPGRLTEATLQARRFRTVTRSALKKVLLLSVMRRDRALHADVLNEMRAIHDGAAGQGGMQVRAAYLSNLVDLLNELRSVDRNALADWLGDDQAGWLQEFHVPARLEQGVWLNDPSRNAAIAGV